MSTDVDLNAARAARREANKEMPTVTFGDQIFALPVELPVQAIEKMDTLQQSKEGPGAATAILDLTRVLFGERYQEFMDLQPSLDDLTALFEGIMPLYGGEAGESSASAV